MEAHKALTFDTGPPQGDYKPAIRISKSDFMIIAKNKHTLNKQDFVDRMRDQLEAYIQSRLSSTSEFWRDEPHDYNTTGPLKYVLMEQLKMRRQLQQLLKRDSRGLHDSNAPCAGGSTDDTAGKGVLEIAKAPGVEINEIGERLRQLVSEGKAGGDLAEQMGRISERLKQLASYLEQCQPPAGAGAAGPNAATTPACTPALPQSSPNGSRPGSPKTRRLGCPWPAEPYTRGDINGSNSSVFDLLVEAEDQALPQQSPTLIHLQPAPTRKQLTGPGKPKADRGSDAGDSTSQRIGGARVAGKPRGGERHVASLPPLPPSQHRLSWSEEGRGRKGGGPAVHSNGVVSLHCEGWRSDLVLIGNGSGRSGHGLNRSSWFG